MMKRLFIILIGLMIINNLPVISKGMNFPYSVGPFITLKGGVNAADVPTGIKNGFSINGLPDFGATGYIPLGDKSQFGIAADLAYSTYAYELKNSSGENKQTVQVSYFTLSPNIFIYGFTAGFNFGVPLSGKIMTPDYDADIKTDELNLFAEIRLGAAIPLYYDDYGRLNLIIQFGYFLTKQRADDYSSSYNYHPASGAIGVSYLFNLPD